MDADGDGERLTFRPAARLAGILGQHLIKDNVTGVLELVKNGYDADARHVKVELADTSDSEKTVVIVEDDGTGMDESVIRGPWCEPAHGGKQHNKNRIRRTQKGRLQIGEKGVGRFATQRLGRRLKMVTRPKGEDTEYVVSVNWSDFDKAGAYLDQTEFYLEKRQPEVFAGDRHGTRLVMAGSPNKWNGVHVEALRDSMMRLLSPTRDAGDFTVTLICKEYPEFENLEKDDVLKKFWFKIVCDIDQKGRASYRYYERDSSGRVEDRKGSINLWSTVNKQADRFDPLCGPFRVVMFAWLRTRSDLEKYGLSSIRLNRLCGISIYRDGFRIIPYGDSGNDWLGLDLRRTNSPGNKYGNNQIIGQVEISQEHNKKLIDKTSREGLQENQEFDDMHELVRGVIGVLETESSKARAEKKTPRETKKELRSEVTKLKKQVGELQDHANSQGAGYKKAESSESGKGSVTVPEEKFSAMTKQVERVNAAASEVKFGTLENEDDDVFLHLVGLGLATERFTHEFDRLVAGMSKHLEWVENNNPQATSVRALRNSFNQLKNEVALISTSRLVKRPPESEQTSVRKTLERSLDAHKTYIDAYKISVEFPDGDDFVVDISEASMSQVLDNVIDNACYWVKQNSMTNDRKICLDVNANARTVVISDSGMPIAPNVRKTLFDKFVTTKPSGRGLGLYIASEILKKNSGEIGFLAERDPKNRFSKAAFAVSFER